MCTKKPFGCRVAHRNSQTLIGHATCTNHVVDGLLPVLQAVDHVHLHLLLQPLGGRREVGRLRRGVPTELSLQLLENRFVSDQFQLKVLFR